MPKRLFDFILAFAGLVFLLPLFIAIAIWIKIDSKGPAFFRQWRVGQFGRKFKIYKFRTMIEDAESKGGKITTSNDPRITNSGKFLRRHKLDELPQLINVLRGDMSFVGPRPEVSKYVEMCQDDYRDVLKVKPGITDLASLKFRDESSILEKSDNPEKVYLAQILPEKIWLAKEYLKRSSMLFDLKIIFATVFDKKIGLGGKD